MDERAGITALLTIKFIIMKHFPNGFTSWAETHHEVVQFITNEEQANKIIGEDVVTYIASQMGTGGLYELAMKWTDEFEEKNKDREWDGEFFEELERFLSDKNVINI
jgi:hypothetical protein